MCTQSTRRYPRAIRPKRMPSQLCISILAEWERELDHNVELGPAEPGESYEQYIGKLGRDFIVCLHHTKVR